MTTRICVSILPKDISEAQNLIEKAEKAHADFIEVRMDKLENSRKLSDLPASTKIPLIATNKMLSEKGYFSGSETQRNQTLIQAAKAGFNYVDLNLQSSKLKELVKEMKALGAESIVSHHNYDGPLSIEEMNGILEKEIAQRSKYLQNCNDCKKKPRQFGIPKFYFRKLKQDKTCLFLHGGTGQSFKTSLPNFRRILHVCLNRKRQTYCTRTNDYSRNERCNRPFGVKMNGYNGKNTLVRSYW